MILIASPDATVLVYFEVQLSLARNLIEIFNQCVANADVRMHMCTETASIEFDSRSSRVELTCNCGSTVCALIETSSFVIGWGTFSSAVV